MFILRFHPKIRIIDNSPSIEEQIAKEIQDKHNIEVIVQIERGGHTSIDFYIKNHDSLIRVINPETKEVFTESFKAVEISTFINAVEKIVKSNFTNSRKKE